MLTQPSYQLQSYEKSTTYVEGALHGNTGMRSSMISRERNLYVKFSCEYGSTALAAGDSHEEAAVISVSVGNKKSEAVQATNNPMFFAKSSAEAAESAAEAATADAEAEGRR